MLVQGRSRLATVTAAVAARAQWASLAAAGASPSPPARSFSATAAAASAASAPAAAPLTPIQRIQKDLAYCREQVKLHDNDQYLCSLLLPASARAGCHILRAFNLELAHVTSRHSIPTVGIMPVQELFGEAAKAAAASRAALRLSEEHEPTEAELNQLRIGLMKLQWWRDGLDAALTQVDQLQLNHTQGHQQQHSSSSTAAHAQPVLNMLAIAVKQYALTDSLITGIIEARERTLTEGQPADIPALLAYSESTSSALLYLTLECLGVRDANAAKAASHLGKATGIALALRSLPYSASKKQVLLPKAVVQKHHLDLSVLLCGSNSDELSACVLELASIAKTHVEWAREHMYRVPKEARPALVSATLCDLFLDRLEQHNFNLFDPALGLLPTAPADSADPLKEASTAGVSLSGSSQGLQPLWLRLKLLQHRLRGTF